MPEVITTELLGEHPALHKIDINEEITASWIRRGEGFIGFGVWRSASIKGATRFADARNWWRDQLNSLQIVNEVHGTGTGPILFSSFAFDEGEESKLVIPRVVIGQRDKKSWLTWIGKRPEISELPSQINSVKVNFGPGALSAEDWQNQVAKAITEIKNSDLEKVVLARDVVATSDVELPVRAIISNLILNYPNTWTFLVSNLVGATPELLVRLSKSLVTSRVLAGTIKKSGDEERDLTLAASLAKSSKDLEEHEYAVRSVADALSPFCSSTNVPEVPFVLHLANVMHLATDVTGVINDSTTPVDIFKVISSLHPSAAVCGTPTDKAKALIKTLEGMARGGYAGPVGWIDARGDGEIGIALRSGELASDRKSIRIFAGCGIVAGSNPEEEFAESQAKLNPMRTALAALA